MEEKIQKFRVHSQREITFVRGGNRPIEIVLRGD